MAEFSLKNIYILFFNFIFSLLLNSVHQFLTRSTSLLCQLLKKKSKHINKMSIDIIEIQVETCYSESSV